MNTLILTVTRACNLRCAYCPTVKEGWPSLSMEDARRAIDLFVARCGGGTIKLFGGEPLLAPEVVRGVLEDVVDRPEIKRVYLSTNGLGLDEDWLRYLARYPKAVLTISLDGAPDDHRKYRRALEGVDDAYDHVMALRPILLTVPRVVITQTIPPHTAARAADNLQHLIDAGFTRFNLLPGYYIPWREAQLGHLRVAFDAIGDLIEARWARGERFYLRNLFTLQPTPFFNTGFIVDADATIHPTNVGLSGNLDDLLEQTRCGTLDDPPSPEVLATKTAEVNDMLRERLPPRVWDSTMAVDAELTRLCQRLYGPYRRYRARRRAGVAA